MKIDIELNSYMADKFFLTYLDDHIDTINREIQRILRSIKNDEEYPAQMENLKDCYHTLTFLNRTRTYFSVPGSYEEVYPNIIERR